MIDISNSVVGILRRAKKRGVVYFMPDMLYQGKDDAEKIELICPH